MTSETVAAWGRVLIGLVLVATVPVLCLAQVDVPAPLWALVGLPIGWFFKGYEKANL